MNPDLSSDLPEENALPTEKIPKINLPPKPMLVSTLPPKTDELRLPETEALPPAIPTYVPEASPVAPESSKKTSAFSISLPMALLAFLVALFALGVELWILL